MFPMRLLCSARHILRAKDRKREDFTNMTTTPSFGTPLRQRTFQSRHGSRRRPLAVAVPSLRAQGKLEKSKVTIAVGGKAAFYYLPLTIAEQLGYFKAEGLDVEIVDFAGGSRACRRWWAARPTSSAVRTSTPSTCRARTSTSSAFVLQGRAPQIAVGVSTKAMPNYKTLADLKGKKIGVSAPGSSTNMVANLC
jgi:NitT/TauT family transport system substrate-binding protein